MRALPNLAPPTRPSGLAGARAALAPHWGAVAALALFLLAALTLLDDYGVTYDEPGNSQRATSVWAFLVGEDDAFASSLFFVRLYGPSVDLALLFSERLLGLDHGRGVYLAHHLLIHLFFLTGGLFTYLTARRVFGGRLVALFAMLVFLLHPRLYANSFYNSKDISFLVMFALTLFLTHRAMRRGGLPDFILLGVVVGALVHLRITGLILLAAIPAMRTPELFLAAGWERRKRVLVAVGASTLAAALTTYALLPYLWGDPIGRFTEWWLTATKHPLVFIEPFRGTLYLTSDLPPSHVPVWFSITTPPFALLLGAVGAAAVVLRGIRTPRVALGNTSLRFGALTFGCFALPILTVALLNATTFNDWRHLYFLWAPFSLLAAFGLRELIATLRIARLRAAVYGAAGAGLAVAAVSMALIHPNQQVFFNFLVDRVSPEYLRTQYVMDYQGHPVRQTLEWVADRHPSAQAVYATGNHTIGLVSDNAHALPDASPGQTSGGVSLDDFAVRYGIRADYDAAAYRVQVYGNTIAALESKDRIRSVYNRTLALRPISSDSAYDIYRLDGEAVFVKEPCAPSHLTKQEPRLRVTPVNRGDLPYWRTDRGFEAFTVVLAGHGARFDGKCVASVPLPDYAIAQLEVSLSPELMTDDAARETARLAKEKGRLLARSFYDVYRTDNEIVYLKEQCDPLETEHPFYISLFPQQAGDLPEEWREQGFERYWFDFYRNGALSDEACVATVPLPDYPVAGVRTGQRAQDGRRLWSAEFSANPEPYRMAYRAALSVEPLARGVFDLYLFADELLYVKEPCEQADAEERLFLHVVPQRVGELPDRWRQLGFANLDFDFFLNGAWFDGRCVARVALPPYAIASVRTGQYIPGVGETWRAEFALDSNPPARAAAP